MTTPIRLGVVGLGFMGQVHVRAILAAANDGQAVTLSAVADASTDRLTGIAGGQGNLAAATTGERLFEPSSVSTFTNPADLFTRSDLDAVVIATPTDTHESLVTAALRAGKHVLVEKPVALDAKTIEGLTQVEQATKRRIVPAMVMRFWPGWPFLRECIRDTPFGTLHALRLTRLGCRPAWSSFYADPARCGGALSDLHIHDADFVLHAIGRPAHVLSVGHIDHVSTLYRFAKGPRIVSAEGGWVAVGGRGFRMRYTAEFAHATVEFELANTPTVRVLREDRVEHPDLPTGGGYDAQLRDFVRCVSAWRDGQPATPAATLDDAHAVAVLLEAERRSLASGTWEPT